MPTFKTELVGNPNSCIIRIDKEKFHALLDSGTEVSLIHTGGKTLKENQN